MHKLQGGAGWTRSLHCILAVRRPPRPTAGCKLPCSCCGPLYRTPADVVASAAGVQGQLPGEWSALSRLTALSVAGNDLEGEAGGKRLARRQSQPSAAAPVHRVMAALAACAIIVGRQAAELSIASLSAGCASLSAGCAWGRPPCMRLEQAAGLRLQYY